MPVSHFLAVVDPACLLNLILYLHDTYSHFLFHLFAASLICSVNSVLVASLDFPLPLTVPSVCRSLALAPTAPSLTTCSIC